MTASACVAPGAALRSLAKHAEELSRISFERIAQEMDKILLSEKPSVGLRLLYMTNLHRHFLPLEELDVEQPRNADENQPVGFIKSLQCPGDLVFVKPQGGLPIVK